jgi:GxxExxY protein
MAADARRCTPMKSCKRSWGLLSRSRRLWDAGFSKRSNERALVQELRGRGLNALPQVPLQVRYKGTLVGEYRADRLVNAKL